MRVLCSAWFSSALRKHGFGVVAAADGSIWFGATAQTAKRAGRCCAASRCGRGWFARAACAGMDALPSPPGWERRFGWFAAPCLPTRLPAFLLVSLLAWVSLWMRRGCSRATAASAIHLYYTHSSRFCDGLAVCGYFHLVRYYPIGDLPSMRLPFVMPPTRGHFGSWVWAARTVAFMLRNTGLCSYHIRRLRCALPLGATLLRRSAVLLLCFCLAARSSLLDRRTGLLSGLPAGIFWTSDRTVPPAAHNAARRLTSLLRGLPPGGVHRYVGLPDTVLEKGKTQNGD